MFSDPNYKFVEQSHLEVDGEKIHVSTVWLGINHSVRGDPVIFETMIFGGEWDGVQWRYTTEEFARRSHRLIVETLEAGRNPGGVVGRNPEG